MIRMWDLGNRNELLKASASKPNALIHYFFYLADAARNTEKSDVALEWLRKLAVHSFSDLHRRGGGQLRLTDSHSVDVNANGLCNMDESSSHSQVVFALRSTWEAMSLGDFLSASLMDVTCFVALCRRKRRNSPGRNFKPRSLELIAQLQVGLVQLFSETLRVHVLSTMQNTPNIDERQIPSRKKSRTEPNQNVLPAGESRERKPKVQVDLNALWELVSEARDVGLSLPTLALTKKKDKHGGFSESSVGYWLNKIHCMYQARSQLSFAGVKFFNLVTDASTFSTRETGVSVMYSHERDLGYYLVSQTVPGNLISPGELELHESVERLVAIRTAERVASYRVLQALSREISLLTQHKLSIVHFQVRPSDEDWDHPLALALASLTPNHVRLVDRFNGNFQQVRILDKRTRHCWPKKDMLTNSAVNF